MSGATALAPAMPAVHSSAIARWFAHFVLIDILLLTYFPWLVMPYTLFLMVAWAFCRIEIKVDRELKLFFILAVCVMLSAVLSIAYRPRPFVAENIKRAGQLLTSFTYYFYFRWLAHDRKFDPKHVVLAYVLFHTAWSLWFFAAPDSALALVRRLYPLAAINNDANVLFRRFSYFFTDPNTSGYFISVAAMYAARFCVATTLQSALIVLMLVLDAVASGSRGVLMALVLAAAVAIFNRRRQLGRYAVRAIIASAVVIAVVVAAFNYFSENERQSTAMFMTTFERGRTRMVGTEDQTFSDVMLHGKASAGESRITRYRWVTTHLWPLPLGRGYQLTAGESIFEPHSDFFRMIYSYGIIACPIMLWFLFRDWWRYEFAIPALVAFGINTLIDEQKLLVLYLILLAIVRVRMPEPPRRRRRRGLLQWIFPPRRVRRAVPATAEGVS